MAAAPEIDELTSARGILRVAVASDLHAFTGDRRPAPSHLSADETEANSRRDPIGRLEGLIDEEGLSADLLLCPGDLGDRAKKAAVRHGWKMIQRIAVKLGDATVMATVGNHDVSSRPSEDDADPDPTGTLRNLDPLFPFERRGIQQAFFSDNYAIVTTSACRVVMLNSSAHHLLGEREYEFGRVTPDTREKMIADLEGEGPARLNILLCHHHPIEYTPVDEPDRSSIVGGALLLKELNEADLGPWAVVHGHKHLPNLAYAPGSGSSPVIFSAGSLTAAFHLNQQPITRNQFYILEFDFDAAARNHARVSCRFRSWYWVGQRGWLPTDRGSGLPAEGGFGTRCDPRVLAERIRQALEAGGKPSLDWAGLLGVCPEIEFLIPDDLEGVRLELRRIGIGVRADGNQRFEEVAAPWPKSTL
jgi:hypothetical protein